jgi:hypothetical protein
MRNLSAILRCTILASLALGVSLGGMCPLLASSDGCHGSPRSQGSIRRCCCGTDHANCCGMACCQQTSKSDKTIPPRNDDRSQPLGLELPQLLEGLTFRGRTFNPEAPTALHFNFASTLGSGIRLLIWS